MNINLQQLLVALFLLVPGFISTEILKSFLPKKYETDFQWVVSSLLISIVLNALLVFLFFMFGEYQRGTKIAEASAIAKEIGFSELGLYILSLYGLALLWGTLSGVFPNLGVKGLLNRYKLIPYARNPSVWDRVFEVRRPRNRPVTWLKYKIDEKIYLAHLCHSSTHIDMDKSFEIYVNKVHFYENNSWVPLSVSSNSKDILCDGMYLRMVPERIVELYFTAKEWSPNKSIQPTADTSVD